MTVNTQTPARGRLVGFRFVTGTRRWAWSYEVARMHGHGSGNVVRSTKLVLSHKHPHDKAIYNLSAEHAMGVLGWRAKKLSIGMEDLSAKFVREVTSEELASDPRRRYVDHVRLSTRKGTTDTAD